MRRRVLGLPSQARFAHGCCARRGTSVYAAPHCHAMLLLTFQYAQLRLCAAWTGWTAQRARSSPVAKTGSCACGPRLERQAAMLRRRSCAPESGGSNKVTAAEIMLFELHSSFASGAMLMWAIAQWCCCFFSEGWPA